MDFLNFMIIGKLPVEINMVDWIPQVQENLKSEYEIESQPPPIPPKTIETHQNTNYGPSATVLVMESELNSAPALPPKPAPRPP